MVELEVEAEAEEHTKIHKGAIYTHMQFLKGANNQGCSAVEGEFIICLFMVHHHD